MFTYSIQKNQSQQFELKLTNFLPGGTWTPCNEQGTFINSERAQWTRDSLSGAIYLNQPTDCLRFKLSFLTGFLAGIIGGNAISLTMNAAYRTLKVVSLSHFWLPTLLIDENQNNESYQLKTRCVELAKDIARIVATPFAWLGLLFASWGGAIDPRENGPRDGVKIFSSIEIAMYGGLMEKGHFAWAPCYQPNAISHRLGGNINQARAW
jgi:hypothetical protein